MQKPTENNTNEIIGVPFAFGLDSKNMTDYLPLFTPIADIYDG